MEMQQQNRPNRTRTVSITSGKGGVGKTTLVSNIALALSQTGKKVLILDGDLGMANVDIMFNVRPKKTIYDLLREDATIEEVLIEVAPGIYLIPAGSGIVELQDLGQQQKRMILDQVSQMPLKFDFLLIDTAPGIDSNVLYLNSAAQEILVIVTPDPSSLADSYALVKVLNTRYREQRFKIICNQVRDEAEGLALYQKFSDVAQKFLYVSLDYLGSVPFDLNLRHATRSQKLILAANPKSTSSLSIHQMAEKVLGYQRVEEVKGGLQFFWQQLVGVA